jgi:cytochrome c peroxidase
MNRAPGAPHVSPAASVITLTLAALCLATTAFAALSVAATPPAKADLINLGKQIFNDPTLSASGRMACATCHSPQHAYGPPTARPVESGGPALDQQGLRAVPSLRYVLNRTPAWSKQYVSNPAERILEGNEPPAGGFGWDGRFNTLHSQAEFPLLAPNEMANASPKDVVQKLRHAPYAEQFCRTFGATIFNDPNTAYAAALQALERFELDDPSLHPYTSKYDDFLDGKTQLTSQELRGLALFDDRRRGNCASCHIDTKGADGSHPLFTDYQFEALGVPRNPEIRANHDATWFDQGVCGPIRTDQKTKLEYCGLFKTPTLRNVATRGVFFHNGRYHTLREALRFYVTRDTSPRSWYPAQKFDDLPPSLRTNIDVVDEPLTRKEGDPPAWTDAEINDVIAFLQTLTDRDAQPPVAPGVIGRGSK